MVDTKANRHGQQLTETRLRTLIEQSPAIDEIIRLSDKLGPQGRTELLNIISKRIRQGARGSKRTPDAAPRLRSDPP